jgi:tripartite-type tricarboxylate transporter receptor subunit TctC
MSPIASAVSLVREGKLHGLAVSSRDRDILLPDLPTNAESGVPGYESILWFGLLTSSTVPRTVIAKLNQDIGRVLRQPEAGTRWLPIGLTPSPTTPDGFDRIIGSDVATFTKLARAGNIKAD